MLPLHCYNNGKIQMAQILCYQNPNWTPFVKYLTSYNKIIYTVLVEEFAVFQEIDQDKVRINWNKNRCRGYFWRKLVTLVVTQTSWINIHLAATVTWISCVGCSVGELTRDEMKICQPLTVWDQCILANVDILDSGYQVSQWLFHILNVEQVQN